MERGDERVDFRRDRGRWCDGHGEFHRIAAMAEGGDIDGDDYAELFDEPAEPICSGHFSLTGWLIDGPFIPRQSFYVQ